MCPIKGKINTRININRKKKRNPSSRLPYAALRLDDAVARRGLPHARSVRGLGPDGDQHPGPHERLRRLQHRGRGLAELRPGLPGGRALHAPDARHDVRQRAELRPVPAESEPRGQRHGQPGSRGLRQHAVAGRHRLHHQSAGRLRLVLAHGLQPHDSWWVNCYGWFLLPLSIWVGWL